MNMSLLRLPKNTHGLEFERFQSEIQVALDQANRGEFSKLSVADIKAEIRREIDADAAKA